MNPLPDDVFADAVQLSTDDLWDLLFRIVEELRLRDMQDAE